MRVYVAILAAVMTLHAAAAQRGRDPTYDLRQPSIDANGNIAQAVLK
jgi:hypothetical protein